jgi:HPt (histidine-containing phosphotransfer) domain-containing protein
MHGDREACLAAGMQDYISKPVRVATLVEALHRCQAQRPVESERTSADAEPGPVAVAAQASSRAGSGQLDPEALRELRLMADGETTFLTRLATIFLRTAGDLFADLHRAHDQRDAAALSLAAHSLKSNARQFGASALSEMARDLEALGQANDLENASEKIAQAEAELVTVRAAIEALLLNPG